MEGGGLISWKEENYRVFQAQVQGFMGFGD